MGISGTGLLFPFLQRIGRWESERIQSGRCVVLSWLGEVDEQRVKMLHCRMSDSVRETTLVGDRRA